MKRSVWLILAVIVLAVIAYFRLSRNNDKVQDDKPDPIAISKLSGAFDTSFHNMLQSYYSVRDALVSGDTVRTNTAAGDLKRTADSLAVDQIKGDSTGVIRDLVKDLSATVASSCSALLSEKDINSKRKEFNMISAAIWDLVRTSRYGGGKIYKMHCPMAFDNAGADWLSNQNLIRNPYFGDEMLECGSVDDSLDYSQQ